MMSQHVARSKYIYNRKTCDVFYYSASNIGYNVGRENETCIRTVAALLRSCVLDSREECFGVAWLVLIRVPQCLFWLPAAYRVVYTSINMPGVAHPPLYFITGRPRVCVCAIAGWVGGRGSRAAAGSRCRCNALGIQVVWVWALQWVNCSG